MCCHMDRCPFYSRDMNGAIKALYQATLVDDTTAFQQEGRSILSAQVHFHDMEWRRRTAVGTPVLLMVLPSNDHPFIDRFEVSLVRSDFEHVVTYIRRDAGGRFSAEDRGTLQALSGHLIHAFELMQQWQLRRTAAATATNANDDHGIAVVSLEGAVVSMEQRFQTYLCQRIPDWDGKRLPFTLEADAGMPVSARTWQGLFVRFDRVGADYHVRVRKDRRAPQLSAREFDIAERIARGMTFKEIGRELDVAPSTVSTHLYKLYDKIGIRRRADLQNWLKQHSV